MNLKDIFSIFIVVFVYLQLSTQKVIPVVNESFEDCTENGKIQMIDFSQLQFYNKDNESELMAFWGSLLFIIKIQNVIKHGPQFFLEILKFYGLKTLVYMNGDVVFKTEINKPFIVSMTIEQRKYNQW